MARGWDFVPWPRAAVFGHRGGMEMVTTSGSKTDLRSRLAIGIISPPWLPVPPPAYGGTENVLDILARGLVAAGAEVVLVTTGDASCPVPRKWVYPEALGVGRGGVAEEARHVIGAYEMLRDVDVIHDHTLVGPLYALGIDTPPVVTTNHGPFNDVLTPIYQAVSGRIPVIAISENQASTAVGVSIAAMIHHGIDVDRIPYGLGRGGYVAFLGRMHPDKGIEGAISAARAAGVPLRIAAKMSEPSEREYFEANVAPELGGDIEFIGELRRNEKYEFLKEATCLLNPIRWAEPFGMVMIESLSCGTPVVTTHGGAAPEIVDDGETGFVCMDTTTVAQALLRVGEIDRSHCRRVAEERFSSCRMVAEHLTVYRRAINVASDDPIPMSGHTGSSRPGDANRESTATERGTEADSVA
jgi:glycosyltransferase involved in cell wall biosynthesis